MHEEIVCRILRSSRNVRQRKIRFSERHRRDDRINFRRSRATIRFMPDKFTVGLIQMRCTKDADENLSRAADKIREAAKRGAQIICMHELFRGEYFCRTEDAALFDLAEPVPGPATEALSKVARENRVALVVSLFERRAAGIYHNTCAVLDADGAFLGKYRKMHI